MTAYADKDDRPEALTRIPLRDQAVAAIRKLITSGSLAPGARLNEAELAMRLGISRGPLREAIQRLGAEGYVEFRRNRGAFVRTLTLEDVRSMYELREILEVAAARLAAERATTDGVTRLESLVSRTEQALADGSEHPQGLDLHRVLFDLAENPYLSQVGVELRTHVLLARLTSNSVPERTREALAEHHWIVSAVAAGDPTAAGEAMSVHIRASLDYALARQPE